MIKIPFSGIYISYELLEDTITKCKVIEGLPEPYRLDHIEFDSHTGQGHFYFDDGLDEVREIDITLQRLD